VHKERNFFAPGTILALLGVILGGLLIASPVLAVASSTTITVKNHSGYPDNRVYLVVWGKNPDQVHLNLLTGALVPISTADNTVTVYRDNGAAYPDKYCQYWVTLDQLPKNANGSHSFTCPVVNSARLYLSFMKPVYLHIDGPAPAIRDVSDANNDDPSYKTVWDKFEWTLDDKGLHANVTPVDFTAIPLQFIMKRSVGEDLGPTGFSVSRGALTRFFNTNALLSPLRTTYRYYSPKAIDPTQAPVTRPPIKFPGNHFKPYVDWVWTNRWQTAGALKVAAGGYNWTGQISEDVLTLTVDGITPTETHTINKPTKDWDIFACAGVFDIDLTKFPLPPPVTNLAPHDRDGAIKNEIVSALNRGVMHLPTDKWVKTNAANYYKFDPSTFTPPLPADTFRYNIYSDYLHQVAINQLIYGYPYDDKYDQASYLTDPNGTELVVTINNCVDMGLTPTVDALLLFD
jgi:hypothetical protein